MLALAFVAAAVPVRAAPPQLSATADISTFQIQLIDLDPGDGITAALTFADPFVTSAVAVVRSDTEIGDRPPFVTLGGAVSAEAAARGFAAQAELRSGDPFTPGAGPSASVAVHGEGSSTWAEASAAAYFLGVPAGFSLTPHTRVVFSALVSASISVGGGATAAALTRADAGGTLTLNADDGRIRRARAGIGTDEGSSSFADRLLSISLDNLGDAALFGQVSAYTDAAISYVPASVPEPATWALMLAGLALITGAGGVSAPRRRLRP